MSPIRLSDPRALRAYARQTRLALIGLLRSDGPQTATRAAGAIGESVASCSYHLRQMAKHGLVEQAEGGHGREKPWRATAMVTDLDPAASDPATAAAAQSLQLALAEQYFELLARWIRTQPAEPLRWREGAHFGDVLLHRAQDASGLLGGWLRSPPAEPLRWREAAHFGDVLLHLTAGELQDLHEK